MSASLGEEAVLADSGWAGEVAAGVGLVRKCAQWKAQSPTL